MSERLSSSGSLPLPEFVIGSAAVRLAYDIQQNQVPIVRDSPAFSYPDFRHPYRYWSDEHRHLMAVELSAVRTRLKGTMIGPDDNNQYRATKVRDAFATRYIPVPTDLEGITADVIEGAIQADDPELLYFLSWHAASLEPAQHLLQKRSQDFQIGVLEEINDMAEQGYLPSNSAGILAYSFEQIESLDVLDAFASADTNCKGLYSDNRMGIAENIVWKNREFYNIFMHESLHACESAIGSSFDGMASQTSGSLIWLRDAFIEHLTQATNLNVEWDEIVSLDEDGLYIPERRLMAIMLQAGRHKIPMQTLANTFFEGNHSSSAQREELQTALEESFYGLNLNGHPNIATAVAADYNAASTRAEQWQRLQAWEQRITA